MERRGKNWLTILVSVVFTMCLLVANSYNRFDDWRLILGSKERIAITVVQLMIISMIVFCCLKIVYNNLKFKSTKAKKMDTIFFERYPLIVPWMTMIVCWLPNYILYFPGCLTYDIIRQYEQFFSGNITNHHPVVTTLFESTFVKIGRELGNQDIGIAIYLLFTLLFTSFVFAIGFCWMNRRKIPYTIRWIALIFYGFFPIWSAYARTAVKDTLFYPFFVLFILFLFEIVIQKDQIFDRKVIFIKLFLLSIILCLIRHNGIYIIVATFPFFIWYCRETRKQWLLLFLGILIFLQGYTKVLLPNAGVLPGGTQEMLSVPFQQTARYIKYHEAEVTEEEKQIINGVLDYNQIGKNYNPDLSDPVKNTYKQKDENLGAYFKVWMKQLLKHPATYVQATLNGTYGYYGYMRDVRYPYGYYRQPEQMKIYKEKYQIEFWEKSKPIRQNYEEILELIFIRSPFCLLTKPMFYTWMFIFMFVYILREKQYRRYWIVFLPVIISWLICLVSPVNGDMRYMLPLSSTVVLYMAFLSYLQMNEN